ncbi:MAG: homocysteine S-methyltransferase family protein [Clostridia bacterium]|nr:homocysteine S-methyltransferase family protein [Clostridia bacterium]
MNILEAIKKRKIYFDGGFGTVLQEMGLESGEQPAQWNIDHPDRITAIHKAYLEAGSDIVTTNTFGVNSLKFNTAAEYAEAAVKCAKEAVKGYENKYIAYDIGPTGRLIKPMGNMEFEEAVSIFKECTEYAVNFGADLIIIETMNDSYETKAALLAAKENSNLPVFVTNAYDERHKLMTGADAKTMIAMLEGLGADAIGMNCSFGPDKMLPIVKTYAEYASVPIIVNPNAGLPQIKDGQTVYDISPDAFAGIMAEIAEQGAMILGGCCGTTPEHIRKMADRVKEVPFRPAVPKPHSLVSSYSHTAELGSLPLIIGERINPTGKKKVKEALRNRDYNYILTEAIKQEEAGSHILDVNAGIPDIDEPEVLSELVRELQTVTDLPLQIDTSDTAALEKAMRIYNGKPMVNSVNGSAKSMNAVFPLVKKYGGVVVALTMDEDGIPETAEGRFNIAQRIVNKAAEYGIDKKDIIVDPLTMTISSDDTSAATTLAAVTMIKQKLGVSTSLGVSNVSFGLPNRSIINSAFFTMALYAGLDAAIMDPYSPDMMKAYYSYKALSGKDKGCMEYIAYTEGREEKKQEVKTEEITLSYAIQKGLSEAAEKITAALLENTAPIDIINTELIPALNAAGEEFEAKKIFLPQLIMSAEAAGRAFDILKSRMPSNTDESKKIVIATVKGDIHDIGKNIAKALLESYGFYVVDLGRDVPPETVLENAKGCSLIGLSALMTTTVPSMEETIRLMREHSPETKILVAGAVITADYAEQIGADYYAADAMDTVRIAQMVIG